MTDSFSFTVSDMFAGCGGSSTGIIKAGGEVVFAGNHWELAIESHNANHPNVDHDIADITGVHPSRWPKTNMLWASPECTNHSKAKGTKKPKRQLSLFGNKSDPQPSGQEQRLSMWFGFLSIGIMNLLLLKMWSIFGIGSYLILGS